MSKASKILYDWGNMKNSHSYHDYYLFNLSSN
jgi:hypothetical protein